MSCLYEIAKIVALSEEKVPEILQAVAAALPPAFHYPDKACARIRLDDLSFTSKGFEASGLSIRETLIIDGRNWGVIEIYYRDENGFGNDSTLRFLPEEQKLLQTIVRQSAMMIEKKRANEKKRTGKPVETCRSTRQDRPINIRNVQSIGILHFRDPMETCL